jgi:hypothetical protein
MKTMEDAWRTRERKAGRMLRGCRTPHQSVRLKVVAARFSAGQLDVGCNEPDFGPYLNYLHFGEATLTFPQTLVLRYAHFELGERKQPQVADDDAKWFLARLRTLEPLLAGRLIVTIG